MAKTIKNIVIQISKDQHECEERFIVGYDNEGVFETQIITYAELSEEDKTKYDNFKNVAINYIP